MVEEDGETRLKIVYFGVGLSGKTSNLQYVYAKTEPERRTEMVSHATETERLLWFTFAPVSLPPLRGKPVRIGLYTVPGAVFYDESRRTILDGVDGVVLVVDTQAERLEQNIESLAQLEANLAGHGRRLEDTPFVIQYNKRDLPNRMPLADVDKALNRRHVPFYDAIAPSGVGVFDTLKGCAKLVVERERERV